MRCKTLGSSISFTSRFIWIFFAVSILFSQPSTAGSFDDFFASIVTDNSQVIKNLLIRGFDPNTPNEAGETPLILAVKSGSTNVIKVLISTKGIDIDRPNLYDENALMFAAINNKLEIAKILISKGSSVNKTGWTALHYAASSGHIEMLRLLLNQSAYIDAASPNGTTPLMMASKYGNDKSAKFLIQEGADPTVKNNLDLTASDFAEMKGDSALVVFLNNETAKWTSKSK
jgi:ankyrin repeat protein